MNLMKLTREQLERRFYDIPTPIRNIGDSNPCVRMLMDRYMHGDIVTLEELLCLMVIQLATDWDEQTKRMFELHRNATFPIIMPKQS